ncbi:MAG: hypothetical protein MZV70_08085 [Desulfobacterales bacterium]|nr:hypothetical protein [Desulfobacterales bacterium]
MATAASTALPPACSMARPASLAKGLAEETAPWSATTRRPVSGGAVGGTPAGEAHEARRTRRAEQDHERWDMGPPGLEVGD